MMPWASEDDLFLMDLIERWLEAARSEVDSIIGWREAPERKPQSSIPDVIEYGTATAISHLANHYKGIDVSPISKTAETIIKWNRLKNRDNIPDNAEIEECLRAAWILIKTIRDGIRMRIKETDPNQPKWTDWKDPSDWQREAGLKLPSGKIQPMPRTTWIKKIRDAVPYDREGRKIRFQLPEYEAALARIREESDQ